MSRISVIFLLLLLLSFSTVLAFDKGQGVRATLLKEKDLNDYRAVPQFAASELCSVRHSGDAELLILYWLAGNEQYLAYQNPAMTCTAPYPFNVKEVFMVLYFEKEAIIYASASVETADLTNPSCPVPGDTISVSSEYGFQLKPPGLWRIAIPLDSAAVVNGPYFAGFTISTQLLADGEPDDSQDSIFIVTDSIYHITGPVPCMNYNLWDNGIGYVDLGDATNEYYTFPGRLLLHSAGETGGSGGYDDPMPKLTFLEPVADARAGTPVKCWVWDSAQSEIVDSVRYEHRSTSGWIRFDVDADNNHALRNGVDPSGTGPGYAVDLGPAGLTENLHLIRATAFDTLMRTSSTQVYVTIDPTPPRLDFIKPSYMDTICLPYAFRAFTEDDDILTAKFYQKKLHSNYSIPVINLLQTDYGDVNYFAGDGNLIANGEFGEYYCGPTAGAIAIKYWFDMGHTNLMRELGQTISVDTVVERLALAMKTRTHNGTYDDFFIAGFKDYVTFHGTTLFIESHFTPNYMDMRIIFEEKETLPILGLSGNPGLYVVLSAMTGLDNGGSQYAVTVSDPITGTFIETYMRNVGDGSQLLYDGSWLDIDIAIEVGAISHDNSREEFGEAVKVASNWEYNWESSRSLSDDSLYYITSIGVDEQSRTEYFTTVIRYHCNIDRVKGDYDGNGEANSMDILFLMNYIYQDGTAPIGGAHRADANCDNQIDIGDVIYIVKYVFESGETPCY